jgi:two-component system cell cycle sensor histidine kinase/response regulator CckA
MYIATILRGDDFQTLEAQDGAQALQIVEDLAGSVDLIVSDIQMPGGDGLTLANGVRNCFPAVSVILISGNGTADDGFKVLTKPFSPGELLQAAGSAFARTAPN